ncbi:hypothetical protein D915_008855 [Fasciola hepatica]|uniref:Uncharacterized protein n=1 Tax=Fasciola hepatica TaxID=6192 RepID=A0A4E0REV3_FASHE|nr:hypothetical protein D915_008855 [Fasciola hepatica]
MDSATVMNILKHTLKNPENCSISEIITHAFWVQVQAVYKKATLKEKSAILDVLHQWAVASTSIHTSPGLELLIPVIWESLVLSKECVNHAPLVFHLLCLLIRADHPNVRFADTLVPMLTTSLHFIWMHSLDSTVDLEFITTLINRSRKEEVSVDSAISIVLNTFVQSLSDSDKHVWKRLLLVTCLVGALNPITSQQLLPSWSNTLATFALQSLQVKRVTYQASCRYIIYELLATLSRYTHDSLEWLRPLCTPTNNAQPLVVLLTSVSVELQLGLNKIVEEHSRGQQPLDTHALVARSQCTTDQQQPQQQQQKPAEQHLMFVPVSR